MKGYLLLIGLLFHLSVRSQTIIPTSRLLKPEQSSNSGAMWTEKIVVTNSSFSGVKWSVYKYTERDQHGVEWTREQHTPGLTSETVQVTTSVCYCDGTPIAVTYASDSRAGTVLSPFLNGRSATVSFDLLHYKKFKEYCYASSIEKPTSEQLAKSEQLYKKAMSLGNDTTGRLQKIQLLDSAIHQAAGVGKLHYEKGKACYFGAFDLEAMTCFQNAITLNYKVDSSYYFKGRSLHYLQLYKQASVALDRATQLNPALVSAWFYLGESYVKDEALADGVLALEHYMNIKPVQLLKADLTSKAAEYIGTIQKLDIHK